MEFVHVELLVYTFARIFGEYRIPAFLCTVTAPPLGFCHEAGASQTSDTKEVSLGDVVALGLGEVYHSLNTLRGAILAFTDESLHKVRPGELGAAQLLHVS